MKTISAFCAKLRAQSTAAAHAVNLFACPRVRRRRARMSPLALAVLLAAAALLAALVLRAMRAAAQPSPSGAHLVVVVDGLFGVPLRPANYRLKRALEGGAGGGDVAVLISTAAHAACGVLDTPRGVARCGAAVAGEVRAPGCV